MLQFVEEKSPSLVDDGATFSFHCDCDHWVSGCGWNNIKLKFSLRGKELKQLMRTWSITQKYVARTGTRYLAWTTHPGRHREDVSVTLSTVKCNIFAKKYYYIITINPPVLTLPHPITQNP